MVQYYRTSQTADVVFTFWDLQQLRICGGNLEAFSNTWEMILQGMPKPPDGSILLHLYYEAIRTHKDLAEEIARFDRMEDADPKRSYQYLINCVQRHLRVRRERHVREEISRSLRGNPSSVAVPASKPADKDGGSVKGKGKGKTPGEGGTDGKLSLIHI